MLALNGKAKFLERLLSVVSQRYSLVNFGDRECPVYCVAAVPKEGESEGEAWLPPAARPKARRGAMGRGLSLEQAMLSCLGEAVELVSSCVWGSEHLVLEADRKPDQNSITLDELIFVSEAQYAAQEDWNRRLEGISRLPDRNLVTSAWINGHSLTRNESCLIPAEYALIGFHAEPGVQLSYVGNSNGCAAGATLDEAIVTGFLELVERDAAAIWWYGLHRRSEIAIEGRDSCREIKEWFLKKGRTCQVVDISTDLGIPVCAAISTKHDGSDLKLGFAASFDAAAAIEKSLTELAQLLIVDQLQESAIRQAGEIEQVERASRKPRLPARLTPVRKVRFDHLPGRCDPKPTADICVEICQKAGLELMAIDFTRVTLGVPVARVLVPGLRQILPAFGPGRMFDVPRRLGWSKQPAESRLNPVPLPA